MIEIKDRSMTETKDTWNLEALYPTDEEWNRDYEEVRRDIEAFGENKGRIASKFSELKPVLVSSYRLKRRLSRLMTYAFMRSDQDTGNSFYQKMRSRAGILAVLFNKNTSFVDPEIMEIGEEKVKKLVAEDAELSSYAPILKEIFRSASHTLSGEMEAVLAAAGEMAGVPSSVFNVFMNADLQYPDAVLSDGTAVAVTNSSFVTLEESADRELRKAVFETYYHQLKRFENTFAGLFEGNVKQARFFASERNFSSDRASYLHDSDIPESVYDNLISEVHRALPDMYRYVDIRKKMLGVEELHMYDVYAPLMPEGEQTYSFEEAKKIVKAGLAPMGEEYLKILQEGFDNRWIDIYPNKGKRSGAYSGGCYDSYPYVLLNFQGKLDDVFTIAHELGHSVHSYYTRKNQPFETGNYRIFVAEVASTCNEAILIRYLLDHSENREDRIRLLNHYLNKFKGTLFRQTMFAEFELAAHRLSEEGKPLTADVLNQLYLDLNRLYFGESMVSDEEIACEWMRIPHFYTPFYVYQYATGFSAAIALSAGILTEGEPAVRRYKEFLKGGCSHSPIELLKIAGVDMTEPLPVRRALETFSFLVEEMEKLI